ncbi:MAG TPA: HAD family hydrolase [Rhodothermales bacterium]
MEEAISPEATSTEAARARRTVAVFDFDGTLVKRDSLVPFLRQLAGTAGFAWRFATASPAVAAFGLRLLPNWRAKEIVLERFIAGMTAAELNEAGERFARTWIPRMVRPDALDCFRWHRQVGHETILLSASIENYLLPLVQTMGFDRVVGTRLEFRDGRATGKLEGRNCYGAEKVNRLTEILGDLKALEIHAYGDSPGDFALLDAAAYGYFRRFPRISSDEGGRLVHHEMPPVSE